jgi:hypothetical protein
MFILIYAGAWQSNLFSTQILTLLYLYYHFRSMHRLGPKNSFSHWTEEFLKPTLNHLYNTWCYLINPYSLYII